MKAFLCVRGASRAILTVGPGRLAKQLASIALTRNRRGGCRKEHAVGVCCRHSGGELNHNYLVNHQLHQGEQLCEQRQRSFIVVGF
jgi:hypothetical protein